MVILFLVTSAINNDVVRLEETRQTIESIHKRVPTASIWLLESSLDNQNFKHPRVRVKTFSDQYIENIHWKQREIAFVKNAIELYTTIQTLKTIPTIFSHIFKISGRYTLTDDFDLLAHPANKATFVAARKTGFDPAYVGTDGMLMTRLYSFCQMVIPQMITALENSEKFFHEQWDAGKVFDMEHGFYKFLPRDILHEVDRIGVRGRIGHLSYTVED